VGLAGFTVVVVKAALVYQVGVPNEQVAERVELCPEQIIVGLADTPVGAVGVGFTVKATLPEALLHPALLTQAT
jgi:hypothetical protein